MFEGHLWNPGPSHPRAEPLDVHVWRIDLSPAAVARALERRVASLSPGELERMRGYAYERNRTSFAVRRGALRELLSRYVGGPPRSIGFRVSEHGKPELDAASRPDVGLAARLRFNASSSEDVALVAVTLEHDLGVDVEWRRRLPDQEELVRTVFSPAERTTWAALPPDQRERAFFDGWTRKEAWLKARGDGVIGDLSGFDVSLAPGDEPRLLRAADGRDEASHWRLFACEPAAGYVGAIAVREPDARLVAWSA